MRYREYGLTIWDFILREDKRQRTWYDIEECIRKWVYFSPDLESSQSKPPIEQVYLDYQSISNMNSSSAFWHRRQISGPRISWETEEVVLAYLFINNCGNKNIGSVLRVFMQELHKYERAFADYIKKQQTDNKEYTDSATDLLLNLANDQAREPVLIADRDRRMYASHPESIGILNFNYTDPREDDWENKPEALNIHGLASQGDIIFGIDGTNLNAGQDHYADIVKFTKTYRLMAFSSDPHRSLVHPYRPNSEEGATGMIKFFGHSLGDADYSYFQAIFDEVNLYESNTHLIFYYNENRRNQKKIRRAKDKPQQEMFEKVNRLITTYGRTLDNEDHGKNLLHKLLLDGRLTIKQAPTNHNSAYFQNA